MKVFLVVQFRSETEIEVQGIFSTEDRAKTACRNAECIYVGMELDEELPLEKCDVLTAVCPAQNLVMPPGSNEWKREVVA